MELITHTRKQQKGESEDVFSAHLALHQDWLSNMRLASVARPGKVG
jgi:hypothetical protein